METKPESLFMDLVACCWWLCLVIPGAALLLGALLFYLLNRFCLHPEHYDYDLVEV